MLLDWVRHLHRRRMQRQERLLSVPALAPIDRITQDGKTVIREHCADLMLVAAANGGDDECSVAIRCQCAIAQRRLALLDGFDPAQVGMLLRDEDPTSDVGRHERRKLRGRTLAQTAAAHDGKVVLHDELLRESDAQPFGRESRLAENQATSGEFVKAVDRAEAAAFV